MDSLKDTVLDAALPHIAFDGWSKNALRKGAEDAGLPAIDGERAFPSGVLEAIDYHNSRADARMVEALTSDYNLASMKIREKIATAVMVRLRQNQDHREAVRRGASLYAMPWNAGRGMKALYHTLDAMWRAAGDTSIDFNFYTKRGLLAKVYLSTLYVWLDDDSDNLEKTEAFLRRRIDDVMKIQSAKFKAKAWLANSPLGKFC